MAAHRVELSQLPRVLARTVSTATYLNTYATAHSMREIFSTPRSHPSAAINLADQLVGRFGNRRHSSSLLTRGCDSLKGSRRLILCPRKLRGTGNCVLPPDCGTTTKVAVNPQITRFLDAFYPLPNGALLCPFSSCVAGTGDTGIFTFAGQQVTPENYFTTKVDHRFSERDLFYGTYMFDAIKQVSF